MPYIPNENTYLQSSSIDLSGWKSAAMSFIIWCNTPQTGYYDNALSLSFSTGGTFISPGTTSTGANLYNFNQQSIGLNYGGVSYTQSGYAGTIAQVTGVDISPYLSSTFRYRLNWHTRSTTDNDGGCFVSNIEVTGYDNGAQGAYAFMDGTSMAAPHVAALASLAWSYQPTLSATAIKNAILNSGDSIPSLAGKTISGKRINAYKTLLAITPSPDIPSILLYTSTGRTTAIANSGTTNATHPYVEWSPPAIPAATMSGYIVQTYSGASLFSTTGTTLTGMSLSFSGNHQYTIMVTGQRVDGMTGAVATRTFTLSTSAPSAPTSVTLNGNNPILAATDQQHVILAGSDSVTGGTGTVIYSLTSSGTTISGTGAFTGTSFSVGSINTTTLPNGTIAINVAVQDSVGNTSPSWTGSLTKDTSGAPVGSITFLSGSTTTSATTSVQLTSTKTGTYVFTGTSISTHTGSISGSGLTIFSVTFTGSNGTKPVSATFTDTLGETSLATGSIVVDATPPATPTNVTLNGNNPILASTNQQHIVLSGSGNIADSGATVVYSLVSSGVTISGTGAFTGTSFSVGSINTTTLPNGTISINVALRDIYGGTSTSWTGSLAKDTSGAPVGTITFLSGSLTTTGTTTVRLTSTKTGTYVLTGAYISTYTGAISGTGNINISVTLSGSIGAKPVQATFTDTLGETSVATGSIILDTTPPAAPTNVTLNGNNPIVLATDQQHVVLSGSGDISQSGATVLYWLASSGTIVSGSGVLAGNSFYVWNIDTRTLPSGTININVALRDIYGFTGASSTGTLTKDMSGAPVGTITFLSGAYTSSGSTTVRLASTKTGSYLITGLPIPFLSGSISGSGTTDVGVILSGLSGSGSDGLKTITVTFTDLLGQTSTTTGSITLDTTPPSLTFSSVPTTITGATVITLS